MKYIFFFLLFPFFGISQTITDTLSNKNGQLILRVITIEDTTIVNNEITQIDKDIEYLNEEIKRLQDEVKQLRKNKAKYKAVRDEKRGKEKIKNNNSPKDSPW